MRPLLLIAGLTFILIWSGAAFAQCNFSSAVYRLRDSASWELVIPHSRDDAYIDETVATLKHIETGKTYAFGWSVANGTGAETLLPLPVTDAAPNAPRNTNLRLYTLAGDELVNGLPNAKDPAPRRLFVEGLDIYVRYGDIDQLELPVGFWHFAGCRT